MATMSPTRSSKFSGFVGGIQEHGPHAIRRGPDGIPTIMVGNNTFYPDEMVNPTGPLGGPGTPNPSKESQFLPALPDGRGFGPSVKEGLHGTIARIDEDTKQYTLLVGGLRNAYDHAFNLAGEIFTFDSDMEWDINMPWYRDVRTVHGIPGGNYGYRNGSGQVPAVFHRLAARRARPWPRIAGRRRVLSAHGLSGGIPRRLLRSRLVARPPALDRPRAHRRDLQGDEGEGRVRPRRAAEHHRRGSRARRPDLLLDRRPRHRRRHLSREVHRRRDAPNGARRRAADWRARGRASAAAAFELGIRGDREGEGVDGRQLRERPRKARA